METNKFLKQNILDKLEDLREKVDFTRCTQQVVYLTSMYYNKDLRAVFYLSINIIVEMEDNGKKIEIKDFTIEGFNFFMDKGETPKFGFTTEELYDYIDY